jgi:hypothetical protein
MANHLHIKTSYHRFILHIGFFLLATTSVNGPVVTEPTVPHQTNNLLSPHAADNGNAVAISTNCFIPRDISYTRLERSDNMSFGPIALPFTYSLYGTPYNQVWINTNGNLTFTGPYTQINATDFPTTVPMVAPFWADVDTHSGGQIYYQLTSNSLIVTWDSVGNSNDHIDKANTFQVVLTNGSAPILGVGKNTAFYYKDMQWTTGDESGGSGGFGGIAATVGINRGFPAFSIQIGRFSVNSVAYDGPAGANDGINYLDNKCFSFDGPLACSTEICNGVDDDCDGSIDEGCSIYYRDADADGYGTSNTTVSALSLPPGYVAVNGDCNDWDASIHPGATEVCNFKDDDCDGTVDEGCNVYYRDADADGYGLWDQQLRAMTLPAGYSTIGGDCNDADASVHPGATEVCNNKDDNCNGFVDEGCTIFYRDDDGDGFGVLSQQIRAIVRPPGYASVAGDCNDWDASIHPGATEVCNFKDDDCDGTVDEGCNVYYRDADADGYGLWDQQLRAMTLPAGYSTIGGDCNDADASVHPGATEVCNNKDDNCNGFVDEGCTIFYRDDDGDGFGVLSQQIRAIVRPPGYASVAGDCNDWDASIHPGATEVCNFKDDDCDGTVDEGCNVYYRDADADGYGLWDQQLRAMTLPAGYSTIGGDCNDSNSSIHPGALELCNGINEDCDGWTDEGCPGTRINTQAKESEEEVMQPSEFSIMAYPNPTTHLFNVQLPGDRSKGEITIRVYDYLGRLIERKDKLTAGQVIKIGDGYSKGVYILEAIQGKARTAIKIVKL